MLVWVFGDAVIWLFGEVLIWLFESEIPNPKSVYPHFPLLPEGLGAGEEAGFVAVGGVGAAGSVSDFAADGSLDWYCKPEALTLKVPADAQSPAAPFTAKLPNE
jgi:hypothetical protein